MEKSSGKLVKVTFEYEHEVHTIDEPSKAQKWLRDLDGMVIFMDSRNKNPFSEWSTDKYWKIVRKGADKGDSL